MNKPAAIAAILSVLAVGWMVGYAFGFNQTRHEYNALVGKWNSVMSQAQAKNLYGTGNWICGTMVFSCSEDGFLDMVGNAAPPADGAVTE